MTQQTMAYPGLYPDENKIIPYSPRRKFGFTSPMYDAPNSKIIDVESMKNMPIDQIVGLYKEGYTILEENVIIPPDVVDERERDRKFGFTGQGSQGGVYISTGAIMLGVGLIALLYYIKSKGKA